MSGAGGWPMAPDDAAVSSVPSPLAGCRVALTGDAVGGVWCYALDIGAGLVRRGLAVTLLGMGPEPAPAERAAAEAAGLRLRWLDHRLEWTLRDAAGAVELAGDLAALVAEEGAELLHLNAPALAAAEFPVPVVAAAHSCLASWWRAVRGATEPLPAEWEWHRRLMGRGLRRSALAVAPSRAFAADLAALYGPASGLHVVPNGVRPIAPQPRQASVLAAGRWWDEAKNLQALDAAAATVRWPVLAAGATRDPAGRQVEAPNLRLLGALDRGAMAECIARAPIFVSVSIYEPFGLAVAEAASAGAALVLADIPTFRELWDGAALFVNAEEPRAIAGAINALIADAGLRRILGRQAASRATCYSVERQVDALARLYAAALASRSVPARAS